MMTDITTLNDYIDRLESLATTTPDLLNDVDILGVSYITMYDEELLTVRGVREADGDSVLGFIIDQEGNALLETDGGLIDADTNVCDEPMFDRFRAKEATSFDLNVSDFKESNDYYPSVLFEHLDAEVYALTHDLTQCRLKRAIHNDVTDWSLVYKSTVRQVDNLMNNLEQNNIGKIIQQLELSEHDDLKTYVEEASDVEFD